MRITVGQLRELFKTALEETKIGASTEYMKKERVREAIQQVLAGMVISGEISNQQDLDAAFGAIDMSVKALKMIPFDIWGKLGATPAPAPVAVTKKSPKRAL